MQRECMEEVGLFIDTWQWVGSMTGKRDWHVAVFRALLPQAQFDTARQCEDQEVVVAEVATLPPDVLPNLRYLIPMCLDVNTEGIQYSVNAQIGMGAPFNPERGQARKDE